jgi:hypothetical protein
VEGHFLVAKAGTSSSISCCGRVVGFNGGLEPESERDKRLSKGTSTFPLVVLPPKPRLICRFEVWGVFGNPGAAGSLAWPGAAVDAISMKSRAGDHAIG